jgi:hypothetical protein
MHEPFPQKIDRFGKSLLSCVMIFANTWTHNMSILNVVRIFGGNPQI